MKKILKILLGLMGVFVLGYSIFLLLVQPSLDRNWNKDQVLMPEAIFDKDEKTVTIKNIRNINYRSTSDFDVAYYEATYDMDTLDSVWYMVEPFAGHGAGAAHTLVSFGFADGRYLSISVEIRKEVGESFGVFRGVFRQYELMYVIADERDVIKLRSNYRQDDVFLYPVVTTKENMRTLFDSMLARANKLRVEPEFYNTLTSTCTTNIVSHVNEIVPGRVPLSFKVLMPAYSDELAYRLGLLDNSLTLPELRERYHINERALLYADDPEFSKRIRE